MSFLKRVSIVTAVLLILLVVRCGYDKEDIRAFKAYIASDKHAQCIEQIAIGNDFLKYGYQNVVDSIQIDTLKTLSQNYFEFLDAFKPQYGSTRKMKRKFVLQVSNFQKDLIKLEERIEVYRNLLAHLDSLQTDAPETAFKSLESKRNKLLGSITTKFLIERTILLINQITMQIKKLELNQQGGSKNGK